MGSITLSVDPQPTVNLQTQGIDFRLEANKKWREKMIHQVHKPALVVVYQ